MPSPLICTPGLGPDAALRPLSRTGGRFPAGSCVFHTAAHPAALRVGLGAVWGRRFGGGGGGPSSPPLTAHPGGCALCPIGVGTAGGGGGLVTSVPLRTPGAARRAAFTHSGYFEFTHRRRLYFLHWFPGRLHWFRFDISGRWHRSCLQHIPLLYSNIKTQHLNFSSVVIRLLWSFHFINDRVRSDQLQCYFRYRSSKIKLYSDCNSTKSAREKKH